ncbi:Monocarboxylate transporter 14-like 4 [Homarus americanus]|uniref:Monocarboxylate transporter 14-like 4 n=1 Tax=Homarus americanus TaxID=6706 RepID=A0A8J5J709_HOMAM|nr:Monocarboxylate transporter 14-like 4 [Homarus americanus]
MSLTHFNYLSLSGVGGGLVGGISFIIVPMYFDRRQGLANTFLTVGICMGQIIITPLVQYLIAEYGFKGATVIYGAILMNGYVAVSFFHPLKWHMKTLRQGDINPPQGDINPPQGDINPPQEGLTPLMQQTKCTDNQGELMDPLGVVLKDEGPKWASVVTQRRAMQVYGEGRRDSECSYKSMVSGDVSAGSVFSITESISFRERNCVESNESLSMMKKLKMMVVRVVETTKSDISILRLRRAQIISLGNFFMYSSFLNFIMMVPFAMQAAGHTLQDSVWCISLMGVSNMVTRLLVSPLSDWKKFNKFFCHMFGVVLLGSSVFVFPFLTSITWLAVTMAVFGVGIGATVTLNSLIIIQFMGIENLPSTYGVSSLLTGIGFPIFGPLHEDITSRKGHEEITSRRGHEDITSARGHEGITSRRGHEDITSGRGREDITSRWGYEDINLGGATKTSHLVGTTRTLHLGGVTRTSHLGGVTKTSHLGDATRTYI